MFNYSRNVIVIATILIQSTNTQEPQCSKYDFLEKLLEKVIRMEISFDAMRKQIQHTQETTGAEMKATKESVNLGLAALVEDRETIKKVLSELKVTQTNQLNEKTKEMEGFFFNQQQAIMTRMSEDLRKMENDTIQKIIDDARTPSMEISFEAMRKDMQHAQESIGAEMKATKASVNLGLATLVEDRETIKKELSELKVTQANQLNEKTKEMEGTFNQQQANITRILEDLRKMENYTIHKIIDDDRTPSIAFRAKMTSGITVSPVQTLVFPHVNVNNGNCYDSTYGHFTAIVNGIYLFTVQLCVEGDKHMVVNLVVGNVAYNTAVFAEYNYVCYSLTDIVRLVKGMQVWVTCASGGSSTYTLLTDSHRQNMFAGVLLV